MSDDTTSATTMACHGCGYILDGLRAQVCPECGMGFDSDDVETFRRVLDDPVRLARLPFAEAVIARMELEQQGMHAVIEPEEGGVIGYSNVPQGAVWVGRKDERPARIALNDLVERRRVRKDWTCLGCREHITAAFDECWNCGCDRPTDDAM